MIVAKGVIAANAEATINLSGYANASQFLGYVHSNATNYEFFAVQKLSSALQLVELVKSGADYTLSSSVHTLTIATTRALTYTIIKIR